MSEQLRDPDNQENKAASAGPFLLAVGIVALILGGIVVASLMSPAEDNISEDDRISRAAADYVAARNQNDIKTLQTLTCANFDLETGALAEADGDVELKGIAGSEVTGDRALVDVQLDGGGAGPRVEVWTLTRDGDTWDVCN